MCEHEHRLADADDASAPPSVPVSKPDPQAKITGPRTPQTAPPHQRRSQRRPRRACPPGASGTRNGVAKSARTGRSRRSPAQRGERQIRARPPPRADRHDRHRAGRDEQRRAPPVPTFPGPHPSLGAGHAAAPAPTWVRRPRFAAVRRIATSAASSSRARAPSRERVATPRPPGRRLASPSSRAAALGASAPSSPRPRSPRRCRAPVGRPAPDLDGDAPPGPARRPRPAAPGRRPEAPCPP